MEGEGQIPVVPPGEAPPEGQKALSWESVQDGNSYGNLPAEYPKGTAAFYCMKRHVTQGEYTDYLNTLKGLRNALSVRFPYGGQGHS